MIFHVVTKTRPKVVSLAISRAKVKIDAVSPLDESDVGALFDRESERETVAGKRGETQ